MTTYSFDKLNELISGDPPETGGILGCNNDKDIITDIILDKPQKISSYACSYEPNTNFLNQCILEWINNSIDFKGIFHTHFAGVKTLSYADKEYIYHIMKNMPENITYLYFPIFVLPDRELICYKAKRRNDKIEILLEDTIIINQEKL